MIRKLAGLLSSPITKGVVAVGIVGVGLKLLTEVTAELRARVDDLSEVVAERATYLRQLQADIAAAEARRGTYPTPEDSDPLGRGQAAREESVVELEFTKR